MRTSTPRRAARTRAFEHVGVGDQVGVGQVDVVRGAVDGVEVHPADRVDHVARDVAVDPDVRLPGAAAEVGQGGAAPAGEQVPVVDEGVLHVPDDVAGQPGVGVAPVGGVQAADVVAADEGDHVVDDQQLAVVAAAVAGEPEARGDQRVPAYGHVGREAEEAPRDDQVGELVEDDVDLDAAVGRVDQGRLERLPDVVALPDEGLEEDPGLGLAGSRPACRGRGPRRRCRPSPRSCRR